MNNQKGVTLIEILASIVLLTIVLSLTFNLLISGQNEHTKQVSANTQLQDVSYAMKLITKDVRKGTKAVTATPGSTTEFNIIDLDDNLIATYRYEASTKQLYRNSLVIANEVVQFESNIVDRDLSIILKNNSHTTYNTKLYFR